MNHSTSPLLLQNDLLAEGMGSLDILVGCEESQAVTIELRKLGHNAFSCDLQECSGGHPEWHLKMDIFKAIRLKKWQMMIVFPDCTFMTSSGLHWNGRIPGRKEKTEKALQFVCDLLNCGIPKIALENPIGCISTRIFKHIDGLYKVFPTTTRGCIEPAQIIQPWQFGDPESKATCLYLIGLNKLHHTKIADFKKYRCKCGNVFEIEAGKYGCCEVAAKPLWDNQTKSGQNKLPPSADRAKLRSKTYPGIATAMAMQWGGNACR